MPISQDAVKAMQKQAEDMADMAFGFVSTMLFMDEEVIRKPKSVPEAHARMMVAAIMASEGIDTMYGGKVLGLSTRQYREYSCHAYNLKEFGDIFESWPQYKEGLKAKVGPITNKYDYARSLLPERIKGINLQPVRFSWGGQKYIARFEPALVRGELDWKLIDMEACW